MGNIRFIHGWECECCSELYSTKRKAINCFDRDNEGGKAKATLLKGFECIDCLTLHKYKTHAKKCCKRKDREEPDNYNYDMVGKTKKKTTRKKGSANK